MNTLFNSLGAVRWLIMALVTSLWVKPHVNYVPGTPTTLSGKGATALQKILYDRALQMDNTLDDIWNPSMENVVDIKGDVITSMPESVFMKGPQQERGSYKMVLAMTTPFKEAGREGPEPLLGYEEDDELLHMSIYSNDLKKAAKRLGWGLQYEMVNSTGVYQLRPAKFKKWHQENRGRRIREASMLTFEGALTKDPFASTVRQQFCSNIFIPNLAIGDMPVWDVTDLTVTAGSADSLGFYPLKTFSGADSYVESIADKMLTASGTGSAALAFMSVDNLVDLDYYCEHIVKMPKIKIGKASGYIFVVPAEVAYYLSNPNKTGSFGAYYKDITQMSKEEMEFGGILGKFKNLWFKVDSRGPTLTVSGSSGSYTLKPGFVNPGNNDDRNMSPWSATSGSVNYVFDVGFVYGAGSLFESIMVPPQYGNKESTEYMQIVGEAMYEIGGIQQVRFDVDTPTDATGAGKSCIQRSLVMVPMSRITGTTLRT